MTWAAVKFGLEEMPPLFLAAMRYLTTTIVLFVVLKRGRGFWVRGQTLRLFTSAILINVGTYGLMFWGMQSVPSGLSAVVNLALIPIMLFSLAAFTGEERLTWTHALALILGCIGLVGLFWTRLHEQGSSSGNGLAAIVVGTTSYCVGSVVARPLTRTMKPLELTLIQAAIGGPTLLILSVIAEPIDLATLSAIFSIKGAASIAFLSLLGTVVAYTIYLILLREWGTARAGLYAFVSPVVALGLGAWLFDESIGPIELAGGLMMAVAAAIAFRRRPEPQRSSAV
ncbi:EamA family transporter [Rhizobium sp. KVB221]|uniref:EamA family transporter n=2 Tax=Rhizobium setariae TaxID=2801340 RepID=A0A936YVD1_9HYPH|nr:EamA family transporter [Rhizobium setariae]